MEDLKTLIKFLSNQKTNQIEIISEHSEMSKRTKALYSGIKNGLFESDDEASKRIYGTTKSQNYRQLKKRLKQRLLNTVFLVDIQEYQLPIEQKVRQRSYKTWTAAKLLLDKGHRKTAINFIENLLKTSLDYDLVELNLLVVKELIMHYGMFQRVEKKFNAYQKLYSELETQLQIKSRSEIYYIDLNYAIETKKSIDFDEELKSKEKEIEILFNRSKKFDSYNINLYLYASMVFINIIKKDSSAQLKIATEALNYFEKKKLQKAFAPFLFSIYKGIAELNLKKLQLSLSTFKSCEALNPRKGSLGWMTIKNYIFLGEILQKKYNAAYSTLSKVINEKSFRKNIYQEYKQHWFIKEAFIQFLVKTKRINPEEIDQKKIRPFRMKRFQNDVAKISSDKKGFNLAAIIIKLLFLILDREYDAIIDNLASLRQYKSRYLKDPEFYRSKIFISMLARISSCKFDSALIEEKTKSNFEKLKAKPLVYSEHSLNIEIIPYEQLWEEILYHFIKEKKRYTR